ncbi:MAG: VCBS repeat-containing protein [Acidobacteria bacterium]|nr:MAG: VCBS repeat-containing protein [Acidobacteriota bacterium]REK06147.1 MAG: VCBS repeat-containing protein [Acidobacteriota bacterium]
MTDQGRRIDGLKQIARYCGWDSVTTAKKYFAEENLPLRTLGSAKKPRYFAWSAELDAWLEERSRPEEADYGADDGAEGGAAVAGLEGVGQKSLTAPGQGAPLRDRASRPAARGSVLWARWPWLWIPVAGSLIAVAVVIGARLRVAGDELPRILGDAERGLEARRGDEVLWIDEGLDPRRVTYARVTPEGPGTLVALDEAVPGSSAETPRLRFLDPETGGEVRPPANLAQGHFFFPEYTQDYLGTLQAVDIDGDGVDEIVARFNHHPNWPSYSVLYEPSANRSRVAFASTGHHSLVAAQDLDGDGRAELLFEGPNNLMGWRSGLAAVRLTPWMDDGGVAVSEAGSPNRDYGLAARDSLLWYALGWGRGCLSEMPCVEIDQQSRSIEIVAGSRAGTVLDFDGFDRSVGSKLSREERIEARDRIYELVRESDRMIERGRADLAPAKVREAVEFAAQAGMPQLLEWVRHLEVRALALAGRADEARRAADAVASELAQASEGFEVFELAKAFHVAGMWREAAVWYERGLGEYSTGLGFGRPHWEYLRGLVLVLVDLGEIRRARDSLAAYKDYVANSDYAVGLRAYVDWHEGVSVDDETVALLRAGVPDYLRYWGLEILAAQSPAGESEQILEAVLLELERNSEARQMLRSLEAELLFELGHVEQARLLHREVVVAAVPLARSNAVVRSHLALMSRRAEAAGASDALGPATVLSEHPSSERARSRQLVDSKR